MDAAKLSQLKLFVQQLEANPAILQDPSLHFFREFLERLGAKLPPSAFGTAQQPKAPPKANVAEGSDDDMPELEEQFDTSKTSPKGWEDYPSDEDEESDVDLDNEGVVSPDDSPPQKMGDASMEVDDEMRDNAQIAKSKAMQAIAAGALDEAVDHLTEAILLNPMSGILYSNRAGVYVKMKKPQAAIRDADAAIKINPDSAKGFKWRGEAKALLGLWEEAAKDLHVASSLDFDDEIAAVLKKVEPNARRLEEHRRKYERLRKEREERRAEEGRQRRRAQAQAAYDSSKAPGEESSPRKGGMPGGFRESSMPNMPGGFPGFAGGMPGAPGGVDMSKILKVRPGIILYCNEGTMDWSGLLVIRPDINTDRYTGSGVDGSFPRPRCHGCFARR
eukprot:TRINITY_DN56_c0_g1_i4.p1 TRINITY_DN56_c0_g1~~TRINITY_DN56_c0_g1_i4.p1  ORF type:complete len:390 (-),score=89.19 TRINITY_DN56_c0_g1_i4:774-1943(-)